jgi:hypothetical protein
MSCSGAELSATTAASTTVLLSWQVMRPKPSERLCQSHLGPAAARTRALGSKREC